MAKKETFGGKIMIIFILLIILITGIVALGFIPFSHGFIKEKFIKIVSKTSFDSCSVKKVSITPFRGITVYDLVLVDKIDRKKQFKILLPKVHFEYRLRMIISRWKELKAEIQGGKNKNVIKKKTEKHQRKSLNFLYSKVLQTDTLMLSCLKTAVFKRGEFTIDSMGVERVKMEEMGGTIHVKKTSPLLFKIKLSAKEIKYNNIKVLCPLVTSKLDDSHYIINKMTGDIFGGKIKSVLNIDLLHSRLNSGRIDIKDSELSKIYPSNNKNKTDLKGKCDLKMIIDNCKTGFSFFKCKGNIKLTDVTVINPPVLNKLVFFKDFPGLSYMKFKDIKGDFLINEGKISSDNLEGNGFPLSFSIAGFAKPDSGYFNFNMNGIFESYYADSVSAIIWNALIPEENDKRSFRCTIYGTVKNPNISLDKELARRAFSSVFKTIGQGIKSIFRKD